jgi:hypothetical protein
VINVSDLNCAFLVWDWACGLLALALVNGGCLLTAHGEHDQCRVDLFLKLEVSETNRLRSEMPRRRSGFERFLGLRSLMTRAIEHETNDAHQFRQGANGLWVVPF